MKPLDEIFNPTAETFNPKDYEWEKITEERILNWLKMFDAAWEHDGNPKSPHAELSSGKCSNAFFDLMRVLCHPNISEILAYQLVRKLFSNGIGEKVDWVVGSSYAAITFSYDVARILHARHGFTEKDPENPKKQMWKRLTIPENSVVLQVEELITTSNTFKEVRRAIEEGNSETVNFLPIIGTIVHRPPNLLLTDYTIDFHPIKIISLIEKEVWAVEPKNCPLCKAGSKRYRPKTHWKELTKK